MKKIILILVLCIMTLNFFGAENLPSETTIIIKRRMIIEDSEYPFNLDGINMYMEDLEIDNINLYNKLLPTVNKMRSKQTTSIIVMVAGGVIAAGGVVYATLSMITKDSMDMDITPAFIGVGVTMVGGGILTLGMMVLAPNENDFHRFVNKHNKINEKPIKINLLPDFRDGLGIVLVCKL